MQHAALYTEAEICYCSQSRQRESEPNSFALLLYEIQSASRTVMHLFFHITHRKYIRSRSSTIIRQKVRSSHPFFTLFLSFRVCFFSAIFTKSSFIALRRQMREEKPFQKLRLMRNETLCVRENVKPSGRKIPFDRLLCSAIGALEIWCTRSLIHAAF